MELKEGIVLRTTKYLENSKILNIATKDGIISLVARASLNQKSKNYAYSQELTLINFGMSESKRNSFNIITCGEINNNYSKIKLNNKKMLYTSLILELSLKMSDHIENHEIFYRFLKNILDKINNFELYRMYVLIFYLKLIYLLGLGPNFNKCNCGKNDKILGFSIENGCLICSKCQKDYKYLFDKNLINVINILYLVKVDVINDELLKQFEEYQDQIERFIELYYEYHLGYISTSKKVINKIK